MSNFDSDGSTNNDWEYRGEVAWNEFDWERYLREQDEAITRYRGFYDASESRTDRIDAVADLMGWDIADWTDDIDDSSGSDDEDDDDDDTPREGDVYTLHKNPIFIATKAIASGLQQVWLQKAGSTPHLTPSLAVAMLNAFQRSEEHAVQAIHALDFGDYAMAISLFKRALGVLNHCLALLNSDEVMQHESLPAFREFALPRLFDLREIWLRVINECRDELDRSTDDEP